MGSLRPLTPITELLALNAKLHSRWSSNPRIDDKAYWRYVVKKEKEPVILVSIDLGLYLPCFGVSLRCHSLLLDTKRYCIGKSYVRGLKVHHEPSI